MNNPELNVKNFNKKDNPLFEVHGHSFYKFSSDRVVTPLQLIDVRGSQYLGLVFKKDELESITETELYDLLIRAKKHWQQQRHVVDQSAFEKFIYDLMMNIENNKEVEQYLRSKFYNETQ